MKQEEELNRLDRIINGACITSDKVISSALDHNQHICAHGTGEIIIWSFEARIRTFLTRVYTFQNYRRDQFEALVAMQRKSDRLWREDLIGRHSIGRRPSKLLEFKMCGDDYVARAGTGRITLWNSEDGEGIHFCCSFGPNSDRSFSGYMPACDMEDAKELVYLCCKDSLPEAYNRGLK